RDQKADDIFKRAVSPAKMRKHREYWPTGFHKKDRLGRPVFYDRVGQSDLSKLRAGPDGLDQDEMVQIFTQNMEGVCQIQPDGQDWARSARRDPSLLCGSLRHLRRWLKTRGERGDEGGWDSLQVLTPTRRGRQALEGLKWGKMRRLANGFVFGVQAPPAPPVPAATAPVSADTPAQPPDPSPTAPGHPSRCVWRRLFFGPWLQARRRFVLTRLSREAGHPVDQMTTVLDLTGLGVRHMSKEAVAYTRRISEIFQDNYSGMTCSLLILNAPWVFNKGWQIIESFLSEDTVAKVKVLGKGEAGLRELEKYVPEENIPEFMGGESPAVIGPSDPLWTEVDSAVRSWAEGGDPFLDPAEVKRVSHLIARERTVLSSSASGLASKSKQES
ncbi:unnamed protein product, partial [Hapterophycus canaliculatus]